MPSPRVPFSALRELLLGLGFHERRLPSKHRVFEHEPSGTLFVFRPYTPRQRVADYDILSVQKHLDLRGVLEQADFEERLHSASA